MDGEHDTETSLRGIGAGLWIFAALKRTEAAFAAQINIKGGVVIIFKMERFGEVRDCTVDQTDEGTIVCFCPDIGFSHFDR